MAAAGKEKAGVGGKEEKAAKADVAGKAVERVVDGASAAVGEVEDVAADVDEDGAERHLGSDLECHGRMCAHGSAGPLVHVRSSICSQCVRNCFILDVLYQRG